MAEGTEKNGDSRCLRPWVVGVPVDRMDMSWMVGYAGLAHMRKNEVVLELELRRKLEERRERDRDPE